MYVRTQSSSSAAPILKVAIPLFIVFGITLLTGCNGQTAELRVQGDAETYIRQHIADLSPSDATLGGSFQVSDITWVDEDTALVTYDDGHVQIRGRTDVSEVNGRVIATTLVLDDDGMDGGSSSDAMSAASMSSASSLAVSSSGMSADSSATRSSGTSVSGSANASVSMSASTSVSASASLSAAASARAGAGLGEFCGGIAALPCQAGYTCKLDGTYPDAGGTCVKS